MPVAHTDRLNRRPAQPGAQPVRRGAPQDGDTPGARQALYFILRARAQVRREHHALDRTPLQPRPHARHPDYYTPRP